ncbi:hypothetical protein HDV00_011345 [Rhizophlyctis rosea]|nr:hypothetical protein HDV00_011345 [Rhizophlyctis rosea]
MGMYHCCLGWLNCCFGCFKPAPPKPDPFVESLPDGNRKKILRYVHVTSHYLDRSFCGIGLDPIIGLIPILGDAVSLFWAIALISYASQLGLPRELINKMMRNALLDFGIGMIPIVGDVFDTFYKADIRNYKIMREYVHKQQKEAEERLRREQREQARLHRIEIAESHNHHGTATTSSHPAQPKPAATPSQKKWWWSKSQQPAPISEMKVVKGSDNNV